LRRGRSRLRQQNERNRPEAKQNGEYEAEFEKCGLGSGFLFHWMKCGLGGAFADTLEGEPAWMSPGVVIFPKLQQWNALVSDFAKTCQHYFDSFRAKYTARYASGHRETTRWQHVTAAFTQSARTNPHHLPTIVKMLLQRRFGYGLGTGVGRG
jgi:hypothetical protein